MPPKLSGDFTIKQLVQNTYAHMRNRFEYRERDRIRRIVIKRVKVYDGKEPGQARTTYYIESTSLPQYSPYYTRHDSRGRPRAFQRTYRHTYEIAISLDRLSINVPVKIRTGADRKWRFKSKTRKLPNGRVQESENIKLGINGDHFFRLSWIRKEAGILFGRNYANGPPTRTNPHKIQFLTKHEISVIEQLMNMGILKDD